MQKKYDEQMYAKISPVDCCCFRNVKNEEACEKSYVTSFDDKMISTWNTDTFDALVSQANETELERVAEYSPENVEDRCISKPKKKTHYTRNKETTDLLMHKNTKKYNDQIYAKKLQKKIKMVIAIVIRQMRNMMIVKMIQLMK